MQNLSQPREVQQKEHCCGGEHNENEEDDGSGQVHKLAICF